MSSRIPTQQKNDVNYRYGQIFNKQNIKFVWRRQGYGHKLVVGVVDDAIGKGFNVNDMATMKPIEKNDDIWVVIQTMWKDLKKTCYYERGYGKGLGSFYQIDGEEIPIWRAYDTRNYFAEYDEFGRATKYTVTNEVGGVMARSQIKQIIDDELDFTYEIILREDNIIGEGMSVLEPVWDTLYSLSTLDENGIYYAIRYGAGIRYLKIPEAKFKDKVYMANLMKMLRGAVGVNGVYALPYATIAGVKQELEINSEGATQIRFLELRDLLLGTLSAQTGIPREVFLGSQLGLRSSEKNEDSYFDFLQSIQDGYRAFFMYIVSALNDKFGWYDREKINIYIDYIARDTLSKEEKIVDVGKKVDIANKAGYKVPMDYLAGVLEIPLEEKAIDPLGITGAKDPKEDKDDDDDKDMDQSSEDEGEEDTQDDIDDDE